MLLCCTIIMVSCISQSKIAKICATCPVKTTTIIKDSIYTVTKIQYDTTYTSIEGPTKYLPSPCDYLCDKYGKLKPFYQESKKNGIKQKLYTDTTNNTLVQKCDEDSLLHVNEKLTTEINRLSTKVIDNTKTIEVNKLTGFQYFMIYSGYILWLIILLIVGYKLIKFYIFKRPI